MAHLQDFEALQILHADLLALSESRLYNVNRLWTQLESRIADFRTLLDKTARNDQSRKSLTSGKVVVDDVEYSVNEQFQNVALEVANDLDLDEIDAARLALEATTDAEVLGRSVKDSAIIRYHQKRQYLLDCYRITLEQSNHVPNDEEEDSRNKMAFLQAVQLTLESDKAPASGSTTVQKCIRSMHNLRSELNAIHDKINNAPSRGLQHNSEAMDSLEYQRITLIQQHESLGLIVYHLVKGLHSSKDDFMSLLDVLKGFQRYDNILVHYFPAIGAYIARFGGSEGCSIRDARKLNDKIMDPTAAWTLHYVQAGVRAWWLSEYSGRYSEAYTGSPVSGMNVEIESATRTKQFSEALKDGAFDFLLSLSADVKSTEWVDPARHGLRQWLLRKAPSLMPDTVPFSNIMQDALMEQLESFVDAFITNLPDLLRKLRFDEDEQRQLSQTHEHDLDLERFLVIISYAFEDRADAALALFWADPDTNLAGFLQWVSKRASTPLMSAFCEMLQSLACNDECASSAHEFLLDDSGSSTGKMRKNSSLSWNQIFRELKFFTEKIRDVPSLPRSHTSRITKASSDQAETEPESAMMLESYLRLITQLCSESGAVKDFLLKHQTFSILDVLYSLASSSIPARLRACVFKTLRSLVTNKTKEECEYIWTSLDVWISGGYSPSSNMARAAVTPAASLKAMNGIFEEIRGGFEEPNAFVQFLEALVQPYSNDHGLNDYLPFPEQLGSANRMPGIDPYVDFVMRDVFTNKSTETNDVTQLRLIRLSCLTFIKTCLTTFNEDLVVFANRSSLPVDAAIRVSDLTTYVCLHPSARVMEWMFNDKVMSILFEIIHQDPVEVAKAVPDSPLVLCLLLAIEVVALAISLQPTYINVIRPIVKLQPNTRRHAVANAAYATIEDRVLNNLSIFTDLGLLTGVGHPALTMISLKLLTILSTTPKLVLPPSGGYLGRNKTITALETDNESDRITRSLLNELTAPSDFVLDVDAHAFTIKTQILDFFIACLQIVPDRPTIAHLFLGFSCESNTVRVHEDGAFGRRDSIFHATLEFVAEGFIGEPASGVSHALTSLRAKGLQLLQILWRSPLTSQIVFSELRNNEFLATLFVKEALVAPDTIWEGRITSDPLFLATASAECLWHFLASRSAILTYAAAETRQLSLEQSPTLQSIALRTLLGTTTVADSQKVSHSAVFDFFDFMEITFADDESTPNLRHMQDLDMSVCLRETSPPVYDIKWAEELVALRKADLKNHGHLMTPQDSEASYDLEARQLITVLTITNNATQFKFARMQALKAWVQLMLIITKLGGLTETNKTEFASKVLQIITPQLERTTMANLEEALELSKLAKFVILSIDFQGEVCGEKTTSELASDRLFELFRICLRATYSPIVNAELRETLYVICCTYLGGMADVSTKSNLMRKHSMQIIKTSGDRLLDVICDDAYAGDQTCRIAAMLLLAAFTDLATAEDSPYMIDSMIRLNTLGLVVDSIKNISGELADTTLEELSIQFSYYNAKFALLLKIAQSRSGAAAVLTAGLFSALKASTLFSTDPDLGITLTNNGTSLHLHYRLLIPLLRILNACILSRGQQNHQVLQQGRKFVSYNRSAILAVFKRNCGATATEGSKDVQLNDLVEELAEGLVLLIGVTGFLDVSFPGCYCATQEGDLNY